MEQLPGEKSHFIKAKMSHQFCGLFSPGLGWLYKHRWTDSEFQALIGNISHSSSSPHLFSGTSVSLVSHNACKYLLPNLPGASLSFVSSKKFWKALLYFFVATKTHLKLWYVLWNRSAVFCSSVFLNILVLLPRHPVTSASLIVTLEV